MKQTTTNHGWVITGINPLTQLREVISTEMLYDVALSKALTNHTHREVQVLRFNPQEINKQGIVIQQSFLFSDNPRITTTEEGVVFCDGFTCCSWINKSTRCDDCPITRTEKKLL